MEPDGWKGVLFVRLLMTMTMSVCVEESGSHEVPAIHPKCDRRRLCSAWRERLRRGQVGLQDANLPVCSSRLR